MARTKSRTKKVAASNTASLVVCRIDQDDDNLVLEPVENLARRSHQTVESALSEWVKEFGVDANTYVAVSILTPKQRRVVQEVSTVESEDASVALFGKAGLVK